MRASPTTRLASSGSTWPAWATSATAESAGLAALDDASRPESGSDTGAASGRARPGSIAVGGWSRTVGSAGMRLPGGVESARPGSASGATVARATGVSARTPLS